MLSPRLTNCPECANIPSLLKKIDCKLAELGNSLYNNVSYMLNQPIPAGSMLQLIAYRRILTHKYCNPNYLHECSVAMIASRVIRLTVGCVSKCNEPERCLEEPCDIKIVPNPSTTTTSSSSTSTTTSSSSTSTTTSTSSSTTTTTTTICQDCIPVSFTNPNTGNGVTTLPNGLVITTTYVGPSIVAPGIRADATNCAGFTVDANFILLGAPFGSYTLTIDFSYPVNNVYINTISMGGGSGLGISECFTVESNQGTPTVTEIGGCYDFGVVGNVVCGSYQGGNTGGTVSVFTPTPYTQLIITGQWVENTADGFGFDLCFSSCITTTTTSSSSSTSTTTSTTTSGVCPNCVTHDVTIGTQIWMGCNLDVTTYRDGTPIPQVTDPTVWATLTTGAWCYHNNDPANGPIYGKLYNAYAVNNTANGGLAPVGYHVPNYDEMITLVSFLGGTTVAGGPLKEQGFCHWNSPNTAATNSSGFAALGAGGRLDNGTFVNFNNWTSFWSTVIYSPSPTTYRTMNLSHVSANVNLIDYYSDINSGASVRCIKDSGSTTTTSSSSTSTTTTLAPSGFNTIYTHFEAL